MSTQAIAILLYMLSAFFVGFSAGTYLTMRKWRALHRQLLDDYKRVYAGRIE
jgi:hypothetical protein